MELHEVITILLTLFVILPTVGLMAFLFFGILTGRCRFHTLGEGLGGRWEE